MSSFSNLLSASNSLTVFSEAVAEFNPDLIKGDSTLSQGTVKDLLNRFSAVFSGADSVNRLDALTGLGAGSSAALPSLASAAFRSDLAFSDLAFSDLFQSEAFQSEAFGQRVPAIFGSLAGLPDGAAAFATIGTNGKRIDNGRNFSVGSQRKWTRSDGKADGRDATLVTYAFDDSFNVEGISTDRAKTLFKTALQTWGNYAPLDFVEVADPGAGDRVDIYVQSDAIDGRNGTLAFAFFPTGGDITFDRGEDWNENKFLETAVHELGHSLGLDHEDDVPAIMNSFLGNRYSGSAFLFEDDINGIRSLYGTGKGAVTAVTIVPNPIDPTPTPPDDSNLVSNGSFESVPLGLGESGLYSQVDGWSTISGAGFQVDRRPAIAGNAADGTAWVELDVNRQNSTIGQNIDTLTGQTYRLSVDFSDGGRSESTTSMEVFWEGKKLDTLSGGGKGQWRNFTYEVTGGDRSVSTLAFRAIGPSDNVGGFIDNIFVTESRPFMATALAPTLGAGSSSTHDHDHSDHDHPDLDGMGLSPHLFAAAPVSDGFGV